MKKAFKLLASSAALIGSQVVAASEAYLVPDAASPWVFQGVVNTYKGINLSCDVTIELSGPNDAADTVPSFDHSDVSGVSAAITLSGGAFGLCLAFAVSPIPAGNVSYSGGILTLHDVFMTTYPGGDCRGDLHFAWDESSVPQTLMIEQELAPVTGQPCAFMGLLDLTSPGSGDIRAPGDPDHDPHH